MSYTSLNGLRSQNEPPPPPPPLPPPPEKGSLTLKPSLETSVKLAGEEAKDRLYEPKHKKKLVRVLTVIAYLFLVSLAAIMLSMYYLFLWNGDAKMKKYEPSLRPSERTARLQYFDRRLEDNRKYGRSPTPPTIYVKCNDILADMQEQITAVEDDSETDEEEVTSLPLITTTEEENTTWFDYEFVDRNIKKRSIFMKKIMGFTNNYNSKLENIR